METSLHDILTVLMNIECAKCPSWNASIKETRIREAMRHIQEHMIKDVIPNIINHKFDKNVREEVMAHVGGHNNCRALSIRRIRKFCAIPADKGKNANQDLILID